MLNKISDLIKQINQLTYTRNILIKEANNEGFSLREIASNSEMSHTTIAKIVNE